MKYDLYTGTLADLENSGGICVARKIPGRAGIEYKLSTWGVDDAGAIAAKLKDGDAIPYNDIRRGKPRLFYLHFTCILSGNVGKSRVKFAYDFPNGRKSKPP